MTTTLLLAHQVSWLPHAGVRSPALHQTPSVNMKHLELSMSSMSLYHSVYACDARLHDKDIDAGRMLRYPHDHGKVMVLAHSLLCVRC